MTTMKVILRDAYGPPDVLRLEALSELLAAGKLRTVVEQTWSLSEVPAALHRFERGHVRGKLVIVPG